MARQIFRKVALDRLASPERLDEMLRVTPARAWLALGAIGLLIVVAGAWGVLGSVHEKVRGHGILVRSGGVFDVVPNADGRVVGVAVRVGELVREGEVVARIAQPDRVEALREARAELESRRGLHAQTSTYGSREVRLQEERIDRQREHLRASIEDAERNAAWLDEKVEAQERLAAEGLITRQTVLDTRNELEQVRSSIGEFRNQLAQLEVERLQVRDRREREAREASFAVRQAELEVERLEDELQRAAEVVSPYTGRILEIMTEPGHLISRGAPVVRLEVLDSRPGEDLEAVVYVSSADGKRVRRGMRILIAPSTFEREEHGFLLGTVTYVSDFPATQEGMSRILKNPGLAAALAGDGAPYEVHADLIPDPSTPTGYRWSSPRGPTGRVESGTLCEAFITVEERRPVELVLPLLRRRTGV